jgi:hypothetical protein
MADTQMVEQSFWWGDRALTHKVFVALLAGPEEPITENKGTVFNNRIGEGCNKVIR